jgi:hypothetical protein
MIINGEKVRKQKWVIMSYLKVMYWHSSKKTEENAVKFHQPAGLGYIKMISMK